MNLWYLVSIGGTAVFVYCELLDYRKSVLQPLHTSGEANPFTKDTTGADKGYMEPAKSILFTSIFIAVAWVCAFFFHPSAPAFLAFIGLGIWWAISKDIRDMKSRLARQKEILREIKDGTRTSIAVDEQHDNNNKPIWIAAPTFWDVRVLADPKAMFTDPVEKARVKTELFEVLKRIAAKPESEWFKVGRTA